MKTIKQNDSWSCVICCTQMITFCDRDEIIEYAEGVDPELKTSGINHYNMIPFLFNHGIMLGSMFDGIAPPDGYTIDEVDGIQVTVELKENPFLLTVDSWRFEGKQHLVLWDGFVVRDPNPDAPETTKLSQYNIISLDQVRFLSDAAYDNFLNHYRP